MTLIITEISEYGIAMVADSAATFSLAPHTKVVYGVEKLQYIPYLNAGISMWGLGGIRGTRTDIWIKEFIRNHADIVSLDHFALDLTSTLQRSVGAIKQYMGLHLAGYIEMNGKLLPTMYHIRNVEGDFIQGYTFHDFVVGLDVPPQEIISPRYVRLRNGDYGPYAIISQEVEKAVQFIVDTVLPNSNPSLTGISIPKRSLEGRVQYLGAFVRFVSSLYVSSELAPSIGGKILSLQITPTGHTGVNSS